MYPFPFLSCQQHSLNPGLLAVKACEDSVASLRSAAVLLHQLAYTTPPALPVAS